MSAPPQSRRRRRRPGRPASGVTLASLASREIWVAWKPETRDGRTTKTPYDPRSGRLAKTDDPRTWATAREAENWAAMNGAAGVGVVFSQIDNDFLCGIDLDSCRDKATEDIAPWAQEIIDRLASYTEVSPSGTGVKIFFTVAGDSLADIETLFAGKYGRAFKNGGGEHRPAIEIYRGRRYFTVTEESIGPDELRPSTSPISDGSFAKRVRNSPARAIRQTARTKADRRGLSASAPRLKATGASYDEMRAALLEHEDPDIAEWAQTKGLANDERELQRVYDKAGSDEPGGAVEDFVAFMQTHDYVYMPGGDFWPAARVDARLPPVPLFDKSGKPIVDDKTGAQKEMRASAWLAKHAPVEQMTWAPGLPQLVRDKLISDGGWIERKGVTVLNLYRPPTIELGDATKAGPWVEHVRTIYPDEASHIIAFLAHRVQRPHEKINHGLVLGGLQGIGKDTMLEPVKHAVGRVELRRSLAAADARPLQRLPQERRAADLGSEGHGRIRPLQILRPHEGLHGRAAGRAAGRREESARARRRSTSAASS